MIFYFKVSVVWLDSPLQHVVSYFHADYKCYKGIKELKILPHNLLAYQTLIYLFTVMIH